MVDRIIERTGTETPKEQVVIHEDRRDKGSNIGTIVAVVVIILVILFLFGGNVFGGGGSSPTNSNPVQTPTSSPGQ